jgi:hypothetical protein
MDVRIVDRWRNVTIVPTKPPGDDKFAALRDLMASCKATAANPHLEFEMDREFFDALVAQALKDPEAKVGESPNVVIEMQDGRNLPSFENIPIVVEGGHAPEVSPAEFKGA